MELKPCQVCQKNETAVKCGICEDSICKYCAHILEADAFKYKPALVEKFKHGIYCPSCYFKDVEGELEEYERTLEQAKNIDVFFKKQSKETRLVRRQEKPIKIEKVLDRDELIMRLAYVAAESKYNALVDVDLTSEKVKHGSYQHQLWSGKGTPANVKSNPAERDKSLWHNPN